jgi:RNA polymerase sigma-70 factor (family 1)
MSDDEQIKDLIRRISKGNDRKAFETFFKHYHSKLIRIALMFLSSYQDAEDVVSEVMIKLLRQREKMPSIENFEGYLFLAIKNQSINYNKKNNKGAFNMVRDIPQDYLTDSYSHPFEKILEEELRQIIVQTVENLPSQRRMVYKLTKDDGLKCKEVADLLNIAEKTVKKHLELALRDLRHSIQEYYAEKKSNTPIFKISDKGISILVLGALLEYWVS